MKPNYLVIAVAGLIMGLLIAPFERKTVLAAPAVAASSHFQLQSATVDVAETGQTRVPAHELFLLDSENGKVWQYQGLVTATGPDGSTQLLTEPHFFSVSVDKPK